MFKGLFKGESGVYLQILLRIKSIFIYLSGPSVTTSMLVRFLLHLKHLASFIEFAQTSGQLFENKIINSDINQSKLSKLS